MIKGKFVGPGIYVEELDATYSWREIHDFSLVEFRQFCGFLNEKELMKLTNNPLISDSKQLHIDNIFRKL